MKDFKHTHKMHHGAHPVFGGGARSKMPMAMPPMMPPGGMSGIQSAGEDMASSSPGGMSGGASSGMGSDGANAGGTAGAGYRHGGMAKGGNWIKNAIKHPGALHRQLGVPMGEKIPAKKLEKATHSSNPTLAKRARLAETLKGFKK